MVQSYTRRPSNVRTVCVLAAALLWVAPAAAATGNLDITKNGVVELEAGNANGSSSRMATDLAELLDDGTTRRVVTVLGEGSLQNAIDLIELRGIDLAFVQSDVLDEAHARNLVHGVETLSYVAKLWNSEFHLLARRDISNVNELSAQKVNFGVEGDGTGITAQHLFSVIGVTVQPTNDPTGIALAKLIKGEIAAIAFVTPKPGPVFRDIDPKSGLHFLSIPAKATIAAKYAPAQLTAKDYPGLIPDGQPVDTAAIGTVLMAANLAPDSTRYHTLANLVDVFFTQFPRLLEAGHQAQWRDVNLAADLPGWRRFPPAQQWLQRNASVAARQTSPTALRVMFERFLEDKLKASGSAMTQQQKDDLFAQFEHWQSQSSQAR